MLYQVAFKRLLFIDVIANECEAIPGPDCHVAEFILSKAEGLLAMTGNVQHNLMIIILVFNCINNSYMLCFWAGGEDYAQELPYSSLFRKRSSTG